MINFHDVIICIVQGICEIIPVSSSASMMAVQRLFDTTNISLHFKVALHIGSLLAIMVFFRKEIFNIFQALFTQKKKIIDTYFWHLAIGTIPLVIISLYAQNYVKHFNNCKITSAILE